MVKSLLLIVLGGIAAFLGVAIVQERDVFARPWFSAPRAGAPATVAPADAAAAEAAVRELLALVRHVHATGGDARFSERLPASDALKAEVQADADYVRANLLRQDMDLVKLDIVGVEAASGSRLLVRTREYWQVRYRTLEGGESSEPTHVEAASGRYVVAREDGRAIVLDWGPDADVGGAGR